MSKEEIYKCDNCNKELHWQSPCAVIAVFAVQGARDKIGAWYDRQEYPYWKHRAKYEYLLCEKCIGEKVTVNYGDTPTFRLANEAKKFLKKWGFIKKATP